MEIYNITPTLKLVDIHPQIPGFYKFLGAYVLRSEKTAVIDVGPKVAVPNLLQALNSFDLSPNDVDYIILTHAHIDHAGGTGTAIKEMGKAKIIVHSRAIPHLIDPTKLWEASLKTLGDTAIKYGEIEPVPEHRIIAATDEMKLDLGRGLKLEIYLTPGHAPHHLSIFDRANGVLVAGEAAGVCIDGTIRPATPPPFRLEEALSSIDKLIALEPKKLCYGHFGCYDSGIERLKAYRQKLLDWHKFVSTAAKVERNPEAILTLRRKEDQSLNYLDRLNSDEYAREFELLINSINGLLGAVPKQ